MEIINNQLISFSFSIQKLYYLMKAEKDAKKMKRDALMSFLQASTQKVTTQPVSEKTEVTDKGEQDCDQVYLDQNNNCSVCSKELDSAKLKKCGFCNLAACSDHLRKRRKKKGKFERICDNCEDRVIYDIYMKLEAKAEQSLCVQEEIITLKHENFFKEVTDRRQRRREIGFATMKVIQKAEQSKKQIADQKKDFLEKQQKLQAAELSLKQLEIFVERAESSFKQNYEQDWNILSEQNSRLAKELAKIQKKCLEIRTAMEKKEKQIEQAFLSWEQRQFKKKIEGEERQAAAKKKEACIIY